MGADSPYGGVYCCKCWSWYPNCTCDGMSHQGHLFSSHRFSLDEMFLVIRGMGGDETAIRNLKYRLAG